MTKLVAGQLTAPFFDAPGNAAYRTDRVGWLRKLFSIFPVPIMTGSTSTAEDPLPFFGAEFKARASTG